MVDWLCVNGMASDSMDAIETETDGWNADMRMEENNNDEIFYIDPWIRLGSPKQSSSFTGDLAGKYLFFSDDQELLLVLAEREIDKHDFSVAKVSRNPSKTGDYVLCLYWHDSSRGQELWARYNAHSFIKFRWWKSNADTRAGKYSKQYRK